MSRKEKDKQALQQKIFNAATEIITSEGYEKLSIRKIAALIEYSPTTIYNYFKNKEDILMSIAYEMYREVVSQAKKVIEENSQASPREKFILTCHCYISIMLENPEKFRAVMLTSGISLSDDTEPRDPEEAQEGNRLLQDLLEEGMRTHDFRSVQENSAELILISLMGLVFNVVSYRVTDPAQIEQMTTAYINLLLNGIGGADIDKK